MKFIDLTGQRFGRLTVQYRAQNNTRCKKPCVMWHCLCDCGNELNVKGQSLRSGHTQSCGCYKNDVVTERINNYNETHGMSNTRLYNIWYGMKKRCYNANEESYRRYGGRGIKMCEEWKRFEPFMEWAINSGYKDNLTIDRIDNDGNYEPENCRWADRTVQMNNTSRNRFVTIDGVTNSLTEWSRIYGISQRTIRSRLRRGMTDVDAIITPVRHSER